MHANLQAFTRIPNEFWGTLTLCSEFYLLGNLQSFGTCHKCCLKALEACVRNITGHIFENFSGLSFRWDRIGLLGCWVALSSYDRITRKTLPRLIVIICNLILRVQYKGFSHSTPCRSSKNTSILWPKALCREQLKSSNVWHCSLLKTTCIDEIDRTRAPK